MHSLVLSFIFATCVATQAQSTAPLGPKLGAEWRAIEGEWISEPGPGASGSGHCAFRFALGGHLLMRTNHADLAATGTQPAHVHDDLMMIYPGATSAQARAMYWDNEGHVIEYSASWSADGNVLTFLSKSGAGPQFRLTYKKLDTDRLSVNFEIAPPGQTAAFKSYTSGVIRRQK